MRNTLFQKIKNKLKFYIKCLKSYKGILKIFYKLNKHKGRIDLYFNHSLGGGAEIFFEEQLKEQDTLTLCIRPYENDFYTINLYEKGIKAPNFIFKNFDYLIQKFRKLKINIFINNLVDYKQIKNIIKFITELKNNNPVYLMLHDYYCICPSLCLLNIEEKFCELPELSVCKTCYPTTPIPVLEQEIRNEFKDIEQWRDLWFKFLSEYIDEITVFSKSSKEILTKVYPDLEHKVKVKPHVVKSLEKIPFKKNNEINIAVLGNLNLIQKGKNIITQMAAVIEKTNLTNVKITVIGNYNEQNHIKVTGHYNREDVRNLLIENETDIIFISSICPETYSYTTSEAISSGLPVACFNIGAPAERVKLYDKGLIISQINPQIALDEIINFTKTLYYS